MLLEVLPDLEIRGVDYIDPKILKGTEHEYLLQDEDLFLLEEGPIQSDSNSETLEESDEKVLSDKDPKHESSDNESHQAQLSKSQ